MHINSRHKFQQSQATNQQNKRTNLKEQKTHHSVKTSIPWTVWVPVGSSSRTIRVFAFFLISPFISPMGSRGHSDGRDCKTASFSRTGNLPSTLTPDSVS